MINCKKVISLCLILSVILCGCGKEDEDDDKSEPKTFESAIEDNIELINNYTSNALEYCKHGILPKNYELSKLLCEYSEAYFEDMYQNSYKDYVEALKNEFGDNFKVDYSVNSKEDIDSDKIKEIQEYLEEAYDYLIDNDDDYWNDLETMLDEEYDFSSKEIEDVKVIFEEYVDEMKNLKITKAYEIEFEVSIKGSEDEDDFDMEIIIANINGEWLFVNEYGSNDDKLYAITSGLTPVTIAYELELY